MTKNDISGSWNGKRVTIRLVGDRVRKLALIAKDLDCDASPSLAIDHCIDIAEADAKGFGHHDKELEAISDQLHHLSGSLVDIGSEAAKGATEHTEMRNDLADIRKFLALMAGAASSDQESNEPMPISEWLNRIAADEPGMKYALAKATWQGLERRGESKADLDVLVERVAAKQDVPGARIKIPPSVVRIGRVLAPVDAHSRILFKDFYIACQRNGDGHWLLTFCEIGPKGSLGSPPLFKADQ